MLSLLQRVKMANVCVNNQMIASIEDGILAFIAFEPDDSNNKIQKMAKKILKDFALYSKEENRSGYLSAFELNDSLSRSCPQAASMS